MPTTLELELTIDWLWKKAGLDKDETLFGMTYYDARMNLREYLNKCEKTMNSAE